MKIRTMLLIGSGISIILILVFSLVVYMGFNKVAEENERELIAHEIHKTVSELDIVLYEYLTYREERMLQQWNLEYDNTIEIMEEIKIAEEEWEEIKSNYAGLKDLFSQITANYEKQGGPELEERLVAQFLIKSQAIISDCSAIAEKAYNNAIKAQKTANNSMMIALAALFAALIGISFYMARRITKPVDRLTKGAEIIGKGNFKHKINIKDTDELKVLADSFNKMTDDLKDSQEKIQEQVKQLKELDVMKTQFLNMASHELKTPLTPIQLQLEMLQKQQLGKLNKEQKTSMDMILRNVVYLGDLIKNLLSVSRIKSGKLSIRKEKVDLGKTINLSIETIKPFAKEKNIKLISKIPELPIVLTDKDKLLQIIGNLINNAIKFSKEGNKVIVEARKQGSVITIEIKDEGIGVPKDKIENIFTMFYQVDSAISRKYGGTGIGLYICKTLVEALGGKINVKSVVGKGSVFSFSIPVR